jgi:hypothetical protein
MQEDFSFLDYFYEMHFDEKEKKKFSDFFRAIELRKQKNFASAIADVTNLPKHTIEKWLFGKNIPFVIRLFQHYKKIGKPKKGCQWLSINSTRGGLFTGPWVQVPLKINAFEEVEYALNQLKEIENFQVLKKKFGIKTAEQKELLFAYLLGMLIGDSSKPAIKRKNRTTRCITIRLTTAHESNELLGEFTSLCANVLGLRMKKCKNCPAGKCNTNPFYTWISQSSPLIQWVFKACLGLEDNGRTTYDKIKADWLLTVPREFRICFLQGLADSDGFVDLSAQHAAVITHPNTNLIEKIFDSLGVRTRRWLITQTGLWCLVVSIKDAFELPLFSPEVKSYRYQKVIKLFNAKRIIGHFPAWLGKKVDDNIKAGITGTKLMEKILDEDGVAIRTKSINRRKKKMESKKEGIVCLGIESTAL